MKHLRVVTQWPARAQMHLDPLIYLYGLLSVPFLILGDILGDLLGLDKSGKEI